MNKAIFGAVVAALALLAIACTGDATALPESPRLDVSLTLSRDGFNFGKPRGEATLALRLIPGLSVASAR